MTNVLITGCTGFIGSNLTVRLVNEGYSVYGLVRHISRRKLEPLKEVIDRLHMVEGDVSSYHSIGSAIAVAHPQYVVHLAALTPVRLSFEDPFPYMAANYMGTVNLAHAMLEKAPKARLVYASTAEVYGWQKRRKPFREDIALNPASPYAVSKEAADQYVRMAMKIYDLNATVMRPTNSYGRKGEKGYFIEYVTTSLLKGETCCVGAPDSIRDYMYVGDHVEAYMKVIGSEKANRKVLNVSPGNPTTNREAVALMEKLLGAEARIVWGSYPPGYTHRPAIWDPVYLVLDSTKIQRVTDWRPQVTLEEGFKKVIESWKVAEL